MQVLFAFPKEFLPSGFDFIRLLKFFSEVQTISDSDGMNFFPKDFSHLNH
jgi:hypothetical protein